MIDQPRDFCEHHLPSADGNLYCLANLGQRMHQCNYSFEQIKISGVTKQRIRHTECDDFRVSEEHKATIRDYCSTRQNQ